jgi:hypothetical protein
MTSQINPEQEVTKFLRQKGRLSNWMGLLGGQILKRNADQQFRTLQAQQAWVRKQWGAKETPEGGDDVGHTYLGDVHQPPVIITGQPQQQSSSLGPLLAAGLGMLGPAGGVAGYFLNQMMQQPQAQQPAAIVAPAEQLTQPISTTIREDLGVRILSEDELLP